MTKKNPQSLSQTERIEYYLGKDRFKNRFWSKGIPYQWSVPARGQGEYHLFTEKSRNTTIVDDRTNASYYLNNYGYRNDFDFDIKELKGKDIILCLGCSNTFGMAVEKNLVWPSLLQQNNKELVLNLGIPGASNDNISRVGYQTISELGTNIKAVCVLWAPSSLREFVSKTFQSGVHILDNNHLPYEDWWEHIDWVSNNYNLGKNQALLRSICSAFEINLIELSLNIDDAKYQLDLIKFGNYNALGPLTHQAIANWYNKHIKGLPSLYEEISRP